MPPIAFKAAQNVAVLAALDVLRRRVLGTSRGDRQSASGTPSATPPR